MPGMIANRDLVSQLTQLSLSDLNSLMLEVYREKSRQISGPELLRKHDLNRYVKPADASATETARLRLRLLESAESHAFHPLELSPVEVFGTCSAVAAVSQDKILSAVRGTEVLADATNAIILHMCSLKKQGIIPGGQRVRYCTSHRHVRAQPITGPNQLAHFEIFCMVTGGRDVGSLTFEKESLLEHMSVYKEILRQCANPGGLKMRLIACGREVTPLATALADELRVHGICDDIALSATDNHYYQGIRFKILLRFNDSDLEVADGGFVDWSQRVLGSKKERALVSGLGVERLMMISAANAKG